MTADDVKRAFRAVRIGRSGVAELVGLSLFGLFLAAIAAYDGEGVPARERYPYWQLAMLAAA